MDQYSIEKIIVIAVVVVTCIWAALDFSRILLALFAVMPFPLALMGASGSGNLCAADCISAFGFVLLLFRGRALFLGPPAIPLLVFFLTALASSLSSSDLSQVTLAIVRMALATVVPLMLFGSWDGDPSLFHKCFATYLVSLAILSCMTLYFFATGGYNASMYTLGISKNALGTIYGCGVVIALGYLVTGVFSGRRQKLLFASLGLSGIALLFTLSRGGWIATAAAIILILLVTRRLQAFSISLVLLVPALVFVWSLLPEKATDYATDVSADTYVIKSRINGVEACLREFQSSPVIGVGVELRRRVEPHNIVALTLGEMGVVGLGAFLAMVAAGGVTFYRAGQTAKRDPSQWPLVVIGSAVLLVTVAHGLMDVYWRRGVSFMGWSSIGIALCLTRNIPAIPFKKPRRRSPDRSATALSAGRPAHG